MADLQRLDHHLDNWVADDHGRMAVARTIGAIAETAIDVADLIARGPFTGTLGAVVGANADGDAQKNLDVIADRMFREALAAAPVAVVGSEEADHAVVLDPTQPLAVAIDPLDGSSNIDTNCPLGTIFSILPAETAAAEPDAVFHRTGRHQLAAGFVIYGPQTALVFTVGKGSHIATLDRAAGAFFITTTDLQIVQGRREYAINASNYRFWDVPVRAYIDDCVAGNTGPRGVDFNMRWVASLVAETYRIFARGGVFLYPRDSRPGYENGRLRLVYEANPIAFVVEQAGGSATDGVDPILDIEPQALHQRTPLVFGASNKVARIARYHHEPPLAAQDSPLFGQRGLFRA